MSQTDSLHYIVDHIFLPPKLPQGDDSSRDNNVALVQLVLEAAHAYQREDFLNDKDRLAWPPIIDMLKHFLDTQSTEVFDAKEIQSSIDGMKSRDTRVLFIRAQNAALVLRKFEDRAVFETFEVAPPNATVMETPTKLTRSFPRFAVQLPRARLEDPLFTSELASFLTQMNVDVLDSAPTTRKAKGKHQEERDTADPRFITELLTDILRGLGKMQEVNHITKRVAGDVIISKASRLPWTRSPIWLVLRVALQTTLSLHDPSQILYKTFMTFLVDSVWSSALQKGYDSEVLFCIRAKVCRRLARLQTLTEPPCLLVERIEDLANKTQVLLQDRWEAIQHNQTVSPRWAPDELDPASDSILLLKNSRRFIEEALKRDDAYNPSGSFAPPFTPRHFRNMTDFDTSDSTTVCARLKDPQALADFELSVRYNLQPWVSAHLSSPNASRALLIYLKEYWGCAQQRYKDNPENWSLMLLCIFELWVALDTVAISQCPLLKRHPPSLPVNVLDLILLRKSDELAQLTRLRHYISQRHSSVDGDDIFTESLSNRTFEVRFFESSPELQALKRDILQKTERDRQNAVSQMHNQNRLYTDLKLEASQMSHRHIDSWGWRGNHWIDKSSCTRCPLETRYRNLRTGVHEWALPADSLKANRFVFELECPSIFAHWRTATFITITEVLQYRVPMAPTNNKECHAELHSYSNEHLHRVLGYPDIYFNRIGLGSTTKSFYRSHYRDVPIPATEAQVCNQHALNWALFDREKRDWVDEDSVKYCSIADQSTLALPRGRYENLQYAVRQTSHTPNETMANQATCHRDLTLHEFFAFTGLRSGARLQWLNIIRELRSRNLSFAEEAVHVLLIQAVWQVGSITNDGVIPWHQELTSQEFGLRVVGELDDLLGSIEASWKEAITARTIILLACRLLESAPSRITVDIYQLLRRARKITYEWMHELLDKLPGCSEESVSDIQHRLGAMAATCRATYDAGLEHLEHLMTTSEDIAVFIECGITLHDNCPSPEALPKDLQRLLDRDSRVAQRVQGRLMDLHQSGETDGGVHEAISKIWAAYRPGEPWIWQSRDHSPWIHSRTQPLGDQAGQEVHVNVWDGQLLIEGKPLGRLPTTIITHDVYKRIFGQKRILDTVPADMRGMEYALKSNIGGYQVFLALRGDRLVIRARWMETQRIFELIPHENLRGDLPDPMVNDFVHWLDLSKSEIEFRLINRIWEQPSASQDWRLHFGKKARMHDQDKRELIDIHSPSFQMLYGQVRPLEHGSYVIVTRCIDTETLRVEIPRFRLKFRLNRDTRLIESLNMPGMTIDRNQFTGTLVGLRNQLVLVDNAAAALSLPRSRHVLVPFGSVSFNRDRDHVQVGIPSLGTTAQYFDYAIDEDLGRLMGPATLLCKLFQIYLHAVTSHCLPDPLLGCTGTEEALNQLNSAFCLSFQHLGKAEHELLQSIAALTPKHVFYPEHLKVMQQVNWKDLPAMSQHFGFRASVQSILEHAAELSIFGESPSYPAYQGQSSDHLVARYAWKNAYLYYSDLPKPSSASSGPVFVSRSGRAPQPDISHIASMIDGRTAITHPSELPELNQTFKEWETLSRGFPEFGLSYHKSWLKPDFSSTLLGIYDLCRSDESPTQKKYQLLFSLSAMSYSSPHLRHFVPYIVMFTRISPLELPRPPTASCFNLAFKPISEQIEEIIARNSLPFDSTPSANLPREYREDQHDLNARRHADYQERKELECNQLVADVMAHWINTRGASIVITSDYHDDDTVSEKLDDHFKKCSDNRRLLAYATRLQTRVISGVSIIADVPPSPQNSLSIIARMAISLPENTLAILMSNVAHFTLDDPVRHFIACSADYIPVPGSTESVDALVQQLERGSVMEQRYAGELKESYNALVSPLRKKSIKDHRDRCRSLYKSSLNKILQHLEPSTAVETSLHHSETGPSITARTILCQLRSPASLSETWRRVVVAFSKQFLSYQQSQRMLQFAYDDKDTELHHELENSVSEEHCSEIDWILVQVEGNFLARSVQIHLSREMMRPSSQQNSLFQLNMGEGKTSVIVPLVASALSDGQKLVRVVVLRPLAAQMFQSLLEKLTMLANRRIFYMPFSRNMKVGNPEAKIIHDLYERCRSSQGILVVQPEHILSYRLMGVDRLLEDGNSSLARSLLSSVRWMHKVSRDILDESDEILHARYQLVYTIGHQQPLELHPHRWVIIQELLSHFVKHAPSIASDFPNRILVSDQQMSCGGFPRIQISPDGAVAALAALIKVIADGILDRGELSVVHFHLSSQEIREATGTFITSSDTISEETLLVLRRYFTDTSATWKYLLLLRGLLAHGILVYALSEKRWRVDYGPDLQRSMLAVPYRAKDLPSPRSEFGHPDVVIALTCLSYYYSGLGHAELAVCFELLFQHDNPALEYGTWVEHNTGLPEKFRHLSSINIVDQDQFTELFPMFSKTKAVVDFYLSNVVFPKAAKEFPNKLPTSGWDLAETKVHATTGFSGTNDNKYLLPTSITQRDPINQGHTNAKVIVCLLQGENNRYQRLPSLEGDRPSIPEFLRILVDRDIRVLLDVGAQILDHGNRDLAKLWLTMSDSGVEAVIFFNDADQTMVLSRDGTEESFLSSPLRLQLDKCMLYLDDAHTRGTDFKLPSNYQAAVTLGPHVTKDRLVQGCMRMRKLGHGQSVMFFAPGNIELLIRKAGSICQNASSPSEQASR
ncbi:hypothetical protein C8J56DRAFT_977723 [Mycena floridula]|nr:hypothetical protein C8J56DRAFT_977723 [Mycena floridula]